MADTDVHQLLKNSNLPTGTSSLFPPPHQGVSKDPGGSFWFVLKNRGTGALLIYRTYRNIYIKKLVEYRKDMGSLNELAHAGADQHIFTPNPTGGPGCLCVCPSGPLTPGPGRA